MPERPPSMEMPGPAPREGSGPESKEEREAETIRRTFEYRDAHGQLLGIAEVGLSGETVDMPYARVKDGAAAKGRLVLSFRLRGEKGGAPADIDMLGLANRHGVEVVAADERLVNYEYSDDKRRAVVPPLETPLDVGVFLHELGHADQFHEGRFEKIVPLYGRSRQATSPDTRLSYGAVRDLLAAIVEAVPEAGVAMDHEVLGQLARLEERRHAALDRKAERESALEEQERLRDDELSVLVEGALAGVMDIRDFLRRCDEAAEAEGRGTIPPLVASRETEALVAELEKAGFGFAEGGSDDGFGRPVAKSSFRDAASVASFFRETFDSMRAPQTSLSRDAGSGTLSVDAVISGYGRVRISGLPVGEDEFADYESLRGRADVLVADLERLVDDSYRDAMDYADAQQALMDHIDIKAIAALPTKMLERDATRRALQWLREVRRGTGADLLAAHRVPREALVAIGMRPGTSEDGCVGSTAEGMGAEREEGVETTVLEDLKRALATYGADRLRIRPPDDEGGVGLTPVAGLDRSKKTG